MPTRIIRDGILTSDRVNALSERAELFYRRLMSVCDDYGRFSANRQLLRSYCYPLRVDDISLKLIEQWLGECVRARLIFLYVVEGKEYLQMIDFGQRMQSKSKHPEPPANLEESTVTFGDSPNKTALVGGVVGVEDVGDRPPAAVPAPKKVKRPQKTTLPEGFVISARVRRWAAEKGHGALEKHFEAFTSKARAKGYTYADWDEALMTAIRDNWAGITAPTRADTKPVKEALAPSETKEQRDAAWRRQMENYGAPLK